LKLRLRRQLLPAPVVENASGDVIAPSPGAVPEQNPSDALDELLREYDQSVTAPTTNPVDPVTQAQQQQVQQAFQNRAQQLEQTVRDYQMRDYLANEQKDTEAYVAKVDEKIAHFNLPKDFSDRWLTTQWVKDPNVRWAWENRNNTTLDLRQQVAVRAILLRTQDQCYEAAKEVASLDREATADREAVTHAMRGASAKVGHEPPPNLGRMTDGEYRKWVQDNFGYTPL
jgi:hypothetical protein